MSKHVRGILASFVALIGLIGLTAAGPARSGDPRQLWTNLPSSENRCDDVYDYFPGGGLRILWCHAKQDISAAQVEALAGVPIWASGPHQRGAPFDLDNARSFGHYNPEFVKKVPSFAIPGATDAAFRKATQPTYDKVIKERARLARKVHAKLESNPACAKRELALYKANLASANPTQGLPDRWTRFLDAGFCGSEAAEAGYDRNVTRAMVAWWLRRQIDGTEELWGNALWKLLDAYDPGFLEGECGQ